MKGRLRLLALALAIPLWAGASGSRGRLDDVLGVESAPGAFIVSVDAGTPADLLGLDVCNLIAGFNGQSFRAYGDPGAFVAALREAAMASGADLDVWKSSDAGETWRRTRTLVQIPRQPEAKLGAYVSLQVLIVGLASGGPAEREGVQVGEFIDRIDGEQVSTMKTIADVDRKIRESAARAGRVELTLARWKPVRGSPDFRTSYTTRKVEIRLQPQRQ